MPHPPRTTPAVKRGILLVNLGSPASTTVADVRRYLSEFLMDRYVIDSPWPIRKLIVAALILPFRPARTAAAYAAIWRDDGDSPLLFHSRALATTLGRRIDAPVALAMRYGNPSIDAGIDTLVHAGVEEILLVPLYPQHADSTRRTAVEHTRAALARLRAPPRLRVLPPFYDDVGYLEALTDLVRRHLTDPVEHLLFSFHGLPERQIRKADPTGSHCLERPDCCDVPSPAHASCYRHQCFATARAVALALGRSPTSWSVSFQSRLGRLPWLSPYTDEVLGQLPARGVRRLAVVCPAFVADNLETLEEIGVRGREQFIGAGGESLTLVPCLNDDDGWVDALARLCRKPPAESHVDTPR
jgi:ferrochelatase